jgi:hypothetical protein
VLREFGSWSKAKEQAGLDSSETLPHPDVDYNDAEILSHLREVYRREGELSTELLSEYQQFCDVSVAVERFGSWSEAKRRAGVYSKSEKSNTISEETVDIQYEQLIRDAKQIHNKS